MYFTSELHTQASCVLFVRSKLVISKLSMSQPIQTNSSSREGRILLVVQAIRIKQIKSIRAAVTLYNIPESILYNQLQGITPRYDSITNSYKLTPEEEEAIV